MVRVDNSKLAEELQKAFHAGQNVDQTALPNIISIDSPKADKILTDMRRTNEEVKKWNTYLEKSPAEVLVYHAAQIYQKLRFETNKVLKFEPNKDLLLKQLYRVQLQGTNLARDLFHTSAQLEDAVHMKTIHNKTLPSVCILEKMISEEEVTKAFRKNYRQISNRYNNLPWQLESAFDYMLPKKDKMKIMCKGYVPPEKRPPQPMFA